MRRLLFLVVALAALAPVAATAAVGPRLLSVRAPRAHVVLRASFGELQPGEATIARAPSTGSGGSLLHANVVVEAKLTAPAPGTGDLLRWRDPLRLPAGRYWVQVSGRSTGGVTDCMPHGTPCWEHWSNVLEVRVR